MHHATGGGGGKPPPLQKKPANDVSDLDKNVDTCMTMITVSKILLMMILFIPMRALISISCVQTLGKKN